MARAESPALSAIARRWGAQCRVLVLDEFFVSDIGDAMLLSRLLQRLTSGIGVGLNPLQLSVAVFVHK